MSSSRSARPAAIGHFRIVQIARRDPGHGRVPVLARVLDLCELLEAVARRRRRRAPSRSRCASATVSVEALPNPPRTPPGDRRARHHDQQVGAEALDLCAHRAVGALAHRDHRDQRGHADEHAEHRERRAQLVARDRAAPRRRAPCAAARARAASRRAGRAGRRARRRCAAARPARAPRARESATIWPSRIVITRSAYAAISGSCVTRTIVIPLLAVQRAQRRHDLALVRRVEIAGRLVGQQDRGVVDQRARDRHALLLAARELARMVGLAPGQAERAQRRVGALGAALRLARVEQRQRDVLARARALEQIEALEHEADPAAAHLRERRLVLARDVDAFEEVGAARRAVEAAEHVHERRFARARRAHDRDELAALDGEIDAAQRAHVELAHAIGLLEPADFDHRLAHRRSSELRRASAAAALPRVALARAVDDDRIALRELAARDLDRACRRRFPPARPRRRARRRAAPRPASRRSRGRGDRRRRRRPGRSAAPGAAPRARRCARRSRCARSRSCPASSARSSLSTPITTS